MFVILYYSDKKQFIKGSFGCFFYILGITTCTFKLNNPPHAPVIENVCDECCIYFERQRSCYFSRYGDLTSADRRARLRHFPEVKLSQHGRVRRKTNSRSDLCLEEAPNVV